MTARWLLALAWLAWLSGVLQAQTLRLPLDSDRLTAGDLARVLPVWEKVDPAVELGYAPLPGVERRLNRATLARWGKKFGAWTGWETLPDAVLVERRLRRMSPEEVEKLLREALAANHGVAASQVSADVLGFSEPLVPAGDLEFSVVPPTPPLNEPAQVRLRWRQPSGRTGTLSFQARSSIETAQVPVSGGVPQGKALTGSGNVRRGELIELTVSAGGIRLRVPARVEQGGAVGQRILCRNLQSERLISAVLVTSQRAEVKLP